MPFTVGFCGVSGSNTAFQSGTVVVYFCNDNCQSHMHVKVMFFIHYLMAMGRAETGSVLNLSIPTLVDDNVSIFSVGSFIEGNPAVAAVCSNWNHLCRV